MKTVIYVNNEGNIGIGIAPTLADVKLEVKVATNQRFIFRNFTYPSIGAALTLQAINDATTDVVNVVTLGLDWYHASRNNLFSNPTNTIIPTAKVHIIGNNQGSNLYSLKVDNLGLSPLLYVRNDGNVGIGTSNPDASLHIEGTFKLADGTEGIDKVLTSDVDGNATWSTPAASLVSDNVTIGTNTAGELYVINGLSKYVEASVTLTGSTVYTLTHNLGTTMVNVTIWDVAADEMVTGFLANNRTINSVDITVSVTGDYDIIITG